MGDYEELKTAIQKVIRTNGNNEITGAVLQNALLSIIDILGANATFAGVATPNTDPGRVDQNVFYLATEAGTYVNFRNIEVKEGEAVILTNKTGNWVKFISDLATQSQIKELKNKKQDILVSGVNIKTINKMSLLGSGNINIETSGGGGTTLLTEITYDELVALRNAGNLIPGMKYRITDYETISLFANIQVAGHLFDIVVTALGKDTLDEKASAMHSTRDMEGYFANSDLSAWDVRYKLDTSAGGKSYVLLFGDQELALPPVTLEEYNFNGVTYYSIKELQGEFGEGGHLLMETENPSVGDKVFLLAPEMGVLEPLEYGSVKSVTELESGKGLIYRLIDEFENDCPYDFKNIKFLRYVKNGVIDETGQEEYLYTFTTFKDNVVTSTLDGKAARNKLGAAVDDVVMTGICVDNTICHGRNITLEDNCQGNRIEGVMCNNIHIIDGYSNFINGENVKLERGCSYCTIGNAGYCSNIKLEANCVNVSMEGNCFNVTIGTYCWNISFLAFASWCVIPSYCQRLIFKYCMNLTLTNPRGGGSQPSKYATGYEFHLDGAEIELDAEKEGFRYVGKNSEGEVKIWNPADLVD